jgi:NADH-quinone oxidoreductase subunit L
LSLLWLVPGLPFLAAGWAALPRARSGVRAVAIAALTGSLVALVASSGQRTADLRWLANGRLDGILGLQADPVALATGAVVSLVGLAVLVYSLGYVDLTDQPRFLATMSTFVGAMLALVLADSLLGIFVSWELVGLASYLLIGFDREDGLAQAAAATAFLVTRLADLAFLAAVAIATLAAPGGLDTLFAWARSGDPRVGIVAGLILVGVAGKSAQLPFSAWLPQAMRGPTPVSALLHSATMVAAGAFLLVRLFPLLSATPILPFVVVLGLSSSLFASLVALAQSDLKRVLAYSTIGQLGEMIAAVGLGVPAAALLLLFAQAGYKAALFLVAGRLQRDAGTTEMSGLRAVAGRPGLAQPVFILAGVALAGIPISIAFSPRDAILDAALAAGPLSSIALVVIGTLTAAYIARAYRLVFGRRIAVAMPRADGALMEWAGAALVVGVVVLGIVTSPLLGDPLAAYLRAAIGGSAVPTALAATILGLLAAITGAAIGFRPGPIRVQPGVVTWAGGGFGLDASSVTAARRTRAAIAALAAFDVRVFDASFAVAARGMRAAIMALGAFDFRVFDAFAERSGGWALTVFGLNDRVDRRGVDAGFDGVALLVRAAGDRWRRVQTGLLEQYLVAVGAWLAIIVVAAGAIALRAVRP